MSVRRGDGSHEAALRANNFASFQAGITAHQKGDGFDPDEGDHWRDGWIHAAEIAQNQSAILRHLPIVRDALMGSFRLLKNPPTPKRPPSYRENQDRDSVLVNINLALAHLPETRPAKRVEAAI